LTCETSDIITPSSTAAAALGLPEDEEGEEEAAAVGLHAAGEE
jgi:hypothetical protein